MNEPLLSKKWILGILIVLGVIIIFYTDPRENGPKLPFYVNFVTFSSTECKQMFFEHEEKFTYVQQYLEAHAKDKFFRLYLTNDSEKSLYYERNSERVDPQENLSLPQNEIFDEYARFILHDLNLCGLGMNELNEELFWLGRNFIYFKYPPSNDIGHYIQIKDKWYYFHAPVV